MPSDGPGAEANRISLLNPEACSIPEAIPRNAIRPKRVPETSRTLAAEAIITARSDLRCFGLITPKPICGSCRSDHTPRSDLNLVAAETSWLPAATLIELPETRALHAKATMPSPKQSACQPKRPTFEVTAEAIRVDPDAMAIIITRSEVGSSAAATKAGSIAFVADEFASTTPLAAASPDYQ
jgi:hypothetical protein